MRNSAEDPSRLRAGQYRTDANLRVRVRLHEGFSTNPHGWYRWVFDQLDLPADARLLEVGCGMGSLWVAAVTVSRYPDALEVTEVEPLLDYARSLADLTEADPAGLARVEAAARAAIRARGSFPITKDVGLLVAEAPGI